MKHQISQKEWKDWRERLEKKFLCHPLEIIQWEATRRCDMNCQHCGSPPERIGNELNTAEIINALRQIKDEFDLMGFKFLSITGGEPFLRQDLFEILAEVKSFGWISTIHTNGNYLAENPEKIRRLLDLGVRGIGIDLDGPEKIHDQLRNKSGHFLQSIEIIKQLLEFSRTLHLIVSAVVTKQSFPYLNQMWEEIKTLNPHRWRLLPLENVGRSEKSELVLDGKDYFSLLNFVREKRIENITRQNSVQTELGCMGWLGTSWEGQIRPYIWSCIAGKTVLGILHDGGLGACAHIDRAFIQGNVRTDNILNVWENRYQVFRNPPKNQECLDCSEKQFCTIPMHKFDCSKNLRECVFKKIAERR